jgi:hypothetical protein
VTARQASVAGATGRTAGAVVVALIAVSLLLGAWFVLLGGGRGRSVNVNDHTDNAVPTVDRQGPRLSVVA